MALRLYDIVTRLRAPNAVGPDGATIPGSWSSVTDVELDKLNYLGEIQPITSVETVIGQERTKSTHKAFLPPGADVLPSDRLRSLGVDYQVDGEPLRFRIRGMEHHVEVFCFIVRGG